MTQRLAIVERLPGHTEVMGGFIRLARELGYDTHLLYEREDPFHVVEYFQSRFSLGADNVHEWSEIINPDLHFDVIILNTSYVWLDFAPWLQQWNSNQRLIVVHHHPEDVDLNPFGGSVYLTPVAGKDKWIFPLYSKPSDTERWVQENAATPAGETAELPTLIVIGSFEGKDTASALNYLHAGGKLVHYDRYRCHFFPGHDGRYTQHLGLNGLDFMASLARQVKPAVPESDYAVCRFTGALILGVELNCIMLMPERLRKLYGFPEQAVITYGASLAEAECLKELRASPEKQQERRRHLGIWAAERWNSNLAVFQRLLGGQGA